MEPNVTVLIGASVVAFCVTFFSMTTCATLLVVFLSSHIYQLFKARDKNPFEKDCRKPRLPYITDQKRRDQTLKQPFNISKVPQNLDAIVIGSGIGGLTTAVLLSKVGKKVLVLEQHDQAGGCCHTFIDKGYEFDVGIHYIGEVGPGQLNRTLVEQITNGQIEWVPLEKDYDVVSIGLDEQQKKYPVCHPKEDFKRQLLEAFPHEQTAIDTYFKMVDETKQFDTINGLLKILPLWLSWILTHFGIIHLFCGLWSNAYKKSLSDICHELTANSDLRAIFTYCWGDYGASPKNSHFIMQGLLGNHFMDTGGYYPKGGASEFAFNMIPIIEASGGRVFVRANVTKIAICEVTGKATGVTVKKGTEEHNISAPIIISNAGAYNTFQNLLPKSVADESYYSKLLKGMKPGMAAISVFVGLNASNEELKLKAQNTWAFSSSTAMDDFDKYLSLDEDTMLDTPIPLLFVSFPSAKDPNWNNHLGRENRSTCAIITLANWDWYKKWESKPLKKRGDDYDALKKTVADQMIKQACQLFPQIEDKIDYIEIGTPVTNKHYLAAPHGEIYGLDHSFERLQPWTIAQLRPQTDIMGLYLTGQDAMLCGFTGALFGGLLCAGAILGRNTMGDLEDLHAKLSKNTENAIN